MELTPEKFAEKLRKSARGIKHRLQEYRRVLKISEKPDREEFEMSAKVTGAGIIIIGLIGFAFYIMANLLPQYISFGNQTASQGLVLITGGLKTLDSEEVR
ncbi:MAG: protein translocase SEC61 complex subunit gamma [Candidatus Nanohaloarchaea archaeon]